MPSKTKTKRTTSKIRRRFERRTPGQEALRKPGGSGTKANAILSDSLFTVKLKEKPGPEVFMKLHGSEFTVENFDKVFDGLWKAYANAHFLIKGERLNFNPAQHDLGNSTVLHFLLNGFRKLIPREFKFNIESSNGEYYFMLFRYCDGWQHSFHALEVGPVLLKLKTENRPLHDLFLCFLRAFSEITGIGMWDEEAISNTLEYMKDNVFEMVSEYTPEQVADYQETIDLYESGDPEKYARLIRRAKRMKPIDIQKRANRFKPGNIIANVIYQGCELLIPGNNIYNYRYAENDDEGYQYNLDFCSQSAIIWQFDDALFADHEMMLDSLSQEGIQEPCFSFRFDKKTKQLDFKSMTAKSYWPGQLSKYFYRMYTEIKKFNDERSDRKTNKHP